MDGREDRSVSACAVSGQEFYKAVAQRRRSDHESMELSVPSDGGPVGDALAAGNTAVLKPSAYSPDTAKLISRMVRGVLFPQAGGGDPGGRKENQALLQEHFDFIFFTGSQQVGRLIMESAARFLTPVVLELGGKSHVWWKKARI